MTSGYGSAVFPDSPSGAVWESEGSPSGPGQSLRRPAGDHRHGLLGGLPGHLRRDRRIVAGDLAAKVAGPVGDHPDIDPGREQPRDVRVADVVQPDRRKVSGERQPLERLGDLLRVVRRTIFLGEDEPGVLPRLAPGEPFPRLLRLPRPQRGGVPVDDGDLAPARVGLRAALPPPAPWPGRMWWITGCRNAQSRVGPVVGLCLVAVRR